MTMRTNTKMHAFAAITILAMASTACSQKDDDAWRDPAAAAWPATGGDSGHSRYSTLAAITTENVKSLGAAWTFPFNNANSRDTPVVAGGRMFVASGGEVNALDPKTGALLWTHKLSVPTSGLYRGVAIGEGMVFVGLSNGHVAALKADTGALVWDGIIGDDPPLRGQYISKGPVYAKGLVISGLANGDYGIRGRVVALDATSGKQVWRFDTVPAPGESGHETWQQDNDEWKRGGGGVWNPPAIDPDLEMVYFGTGDPVPQWGGEVRGGDNLYTNTAVALDLKTGKLKWHFQTVRHDIWDNGLGTPLILYDAEVDGKKRKGIAIMRTDGYLFLLDRATGKPVFPVEERPVPQNARLKTAPTQPFPKGADQVGFNCVQEDQIPAGFKALCHYDPVDVDMPNAMYPLLTTRSSPMAYSTQTKMFYATGAIKPFWLRRFEDPSFFMAYDPPGQKSRGIMAAIDAKTNKIVWQKDMPYEIQNGSGVTATAGGLIFHGEPDGNMHAYDAKTGETLWTFQTGANVNGAASSYEVDGEQYIAITNVKGVWVFKLGGTLAQAEAPTLPITEYGFAGRVVSTQDITVGVTVYDYGLELRREAFDEYGFGPTRAKVQAGQRVTWTNNGKEPHEVGAVDGSWTTGLIPPGKSATLTFSTPGEHKYHLKDQPWSYAQLVVED